MTTVPENTPTTHAHAHPATEPAQVQEWREVQVHPRYLAGDGGGIADPVLQPLLAAGWHGWNDDLSNYHTTSPCGKYYLGFLPEDNPEPLGLWKAWARPDHHSPRTWMLTADDHLPYEFIQAITTAWADLYDPHHPHLGPDATNATNAPGTQAVLTLLRTAKWDLDHHTDRHLRRYTSPDGRCALEVRSEADDDPVWAIEHGCARWTFWAAPQPYRRPLWTAQFTARTPAALLTAFTAALTDPAALPREEHTLLRAVRPHLTLT